MKALTFFAGFFRDPASTGGAPGKPSMTRLSMFCLVLSVMAVVATACWVALRTPPPTDVILALGGILVTLVVHGIVAIVQRSTHGDAS